MEFKLESGQHEEVLERAEDLLEDDEAEEALTVVRGLHGTPLTSSLRGRALALEVVSLELLERFEEAETLIVGNMKEEGDDFQFVLAAGTEFSELEAFDHAEVFLGNLCELDPQSPVPWYNLAIMYGREERFQEAVQAYDHALERDPNFAPAYLQKGYCMRLMGKPLDAMRLYERYLEIQPADGSAWCALAVMESERGNYAQAYAYFARALEAKAEPEDIYFNWALTAAQKGDEERLLSCLAKLEEVAPESWRTLLTRADVSESAGQVWEAWEDIVEAFDAVVDDGELEEAEYVAASLLRFSVRNDMGDQAAEPLRLIYRYELFSEEVLDILRLRDGRASHAVASHQVVIGEVTDESDDAEQEYYVYGVFAERETEAVEAALGFQARVDESEWRLHSVNRISAYDEGVTGVYWRSDPLESPPDPIESIDS